MNIGNDPRLKQQRVRVGNNDVIQFSDVNNCVALLLSIAVRLLNNEGEKIEGGRFGNKLKSALAVHLVKSFVDNMARVIGKRVNPWFYSKYFRFSSRFKINLYPLL